MAYDQHTNYQPPPRQYYNQASPPQGRQPARYNQYEGYDQGQDAGWDDGYQQSYADPRQAQGWQDGNNAGQRAPPQRQQYQGGYEDMNGQMGRPPPQNQAYVPRDAYGPGQTYNEPQYREQGRGYGPRGREAEPNGPMNGDMQRGDYRGRGNARGQMGGPPAKQRILPSPTSPITMSQDNPFPTFPTTKPTKPKPPTGSMDEAMSLMNINDHEQLHKQQGRAPTIGRGRGDPGPGPRGHPQDPAYHTPPLGRGRGYGPPDNYAEDPRHFQGNGRVQSPPQPQEYAQHRLSPMAKEGAQPPPQRRGFEDANPQISPMQHSFGLNTQRAMTMPQELPRPNNQNLQQPQQQWAEPGPTAGYHGPESPSYIPAPRPSTASGVRHHDSNVSNHQPIHQLDSKPIQPNPAPLPQQQLQQEERESLEDLYDDYYGTADPTHRPPSKNDSAMEGEMPNFDAISDSNSGHRRGYSIENHLQSPPANITAQPYANQAPPQNNNFYQQAQQSRSQPNLHETDPTTGGFVFEMPGDLPAVPAVPPIQRTGSTPAVQNGYPGNPRARGPTPMQSVPPGPTGGRGTPAPMYGPGQPNQPQDYQTNDPRFQRSGQPPLNRNFSAQSPWSDPGPGGMQRGPPQMGGGMPMRPQGPPGPQGQHFNGGPVGMAGGPMNQRPNMPQSRRSNPDALPRHPVPVRPGLMDQGQGPAHSNMPVARPPPVRQYNTDSTPPPQNEPPQNSAPPPLRKQVSVPHPVTFDELNRLRNTFKLNPSDHKTGLLLAKKLVEAAVVLSDEGGRADNRTRNKNREKFIIEAHKIVKKLVSASHTEAMFYLADCYGQGSLGLEVDPKEAFTLYQSAAKNGHAASAYRTAVCCEMGNEDGGGTRRDPLKAVQWYKRAAALGDTAAMYKVGMILLKGLLGQQRNLGEAINMLKRAANQADEDNPHALHELGLLYEAQTGNERIIRDEPYAMSLFRQAAELGYKFSQFRIAEAYEKGYLGCPVDNRQSIAWYSRAAAQEEHQSELALSGWYLTGCLGILEQSDTEAYLWARKAACAEPPLGKALFAMGYYTEVGIGCPRSLEEAKRWYGRAAASKFPKAQERLDELKKGGAKVQRSRERLSRTNQKQHEADCVVM